jgi:hypothetical protein
MLTYADVCTNNLEMQQTHVSELREEEEEKKMNLTCWQVGALVALLPDTTTPAGDVC